MLKLRKLSLLLLLCTMSIVACIGLTACSGKNKNNEPTEPPKAVAVESIKFDGNTVTWDEVSGATSYKIQCAGASLSVYSNKYTLTIGSAVNEVTVEISAKNSVGESEVVGKTFTRIKSINADDMIFDENGVLSWEHVENATGYVVEVNGKVAQEGAANSFSDFTYGEKNVIRIKPLGGENYFSTFGTSATKTYLGAPTNIKYDGEEITWIGSPLASGYSLYINGSLHEMQLKGSSYRFAPTSSTLTIALQSEGDGKNTFTSAISNSITCSKLDDVRNITVTEGKIVWDPVEGATSYKIKLNNVEKTVDKCEFDDVHTGLAYTVSVKPVAEGADFYFANWSANKALYILTAPSLKWNQGLSLDGERQNSLYWDNTKEADAYRVKVKTPSGIEETYDATVGAPQLSYAYLETGTYEVSVCSISTQADKFESKYSEPIQVIRLPAPKLLANSTAIVSTEGDYEKGFTVNFNSVSNADGYSLYREGTLISTTQSSSFEVKNVLNNNQNQGGEINYKLITTGRNELTNRVVKLSSLTQSSTEFVITVLPTPGDVRMNGGSVEWNTVANTQATGYFVRTDANIEPASGVSHKLQSIAVGEHNISVCTAGNGHEILASPYSTDLRVRKLAAPSNIKINTTTDEGKLTWDAPAGSQGCTIYFNGSSDGVDSSDLANINTYMETGSNGVSLVMVAKANYFNDADNLYILESDFSQTKQFTKINPVDSTSAIIEGYNLVWRAPGNISSTAAAKVKYRIYNENNQVLATVDKPEYSLENLAGRLESYTFTILCEGDGEEFFNSNLSNPIAVTKLQNVTLGVSDLKNGYKWNGVPNATKYIVKIGDKNVYETAHTGTGVYELTYDKFAQYFETPGTYNVSVIAVGNPLTMVMDSSPTLKSQVVRQLNKPEISVSYSDERVTDNGQIIVTSNAVDNANGYSYSFSGISAGIVEDGGTVCRYTAHSPGVYYITARAKGGLFDDSGVFYITSLDSDRSTFTLLSAPSANNIDVSIDNVLKWSPISGANGYTIILEYTDGTTNTVENYKSAMYQIPADKSVFSVKICANGNGRTSVSSKFVEKLMR